MRNLNRILLATVAGGFLLAAGATQAANLLVDGSFENPPLPASGYTYPGFNIGNVPQIGSQIGGAKGWTFNGAALVNASSSSAWYGGTAPAGVDGSQFAALQNMSTISQTFTASASTLNLGWLSAGRACCSGSNQTYDVTLTQKTGASTTTVFSSGDFSTVGGSNFGFNSLALTGLHSGQDYTLGFNGLTHAADETAFLDNVILQQGAFPAPPTITRLTDLANTDPGVPLDEHTVVNFDDPNAKGYGFSDEFVRPGSDGLLSGISAPPPGDGTNYFTVLGGGSATFTAPQLLKNFSFYLGSPDSYNSVEFMGPGFDWRLNGTAIWNGGVAGNGNQSVGLRVRYDFNGNPVNKIVFSSTGNSFEFDSLAARAVPEPASWALMILGFGGIGAALRTQRRRPALVLARVRA